MAESTAAIVVIGNEILTGKSQDKNAAFLVGELHRLGVALKRVVVIPDDVDEIAAAVRECAAKFNHVFTSGGIGPTHDDVTIEGIARAFGRRVVRYPELEDLIRGYFGDNVDDARLRMADAPEGAVLLSGEGLRWPVVVVETVYILPGVPELFRSKFEAMRERFRTEPFHTHAVYTNEDEFDIAERLNQVATNHPEVEVGSYPNFTRDDYRVKITIESKQSEAVERALAALVALLDPAALVRTE
ncbi:MAG TPA: competence/damage-inducible protein A [Blastocatellia bacterium]|nr:competence/damage-inducible protein A [Blastocatellia bacterium]